MLAEGRRNVENRHRVDETRRRVDLQEVTTMDFPVLLAAEPTLIPERIYDRIWVESVSIVAIPGSPTISATIAFRKYRLNESGQVDAHADVLTTSIADVVQASASDPDLADIVARLTAYVRKAGTAAGVVSADASSN